MQKPRLRLKNANTSKEHRKVRFHLSGHEYNFLEDILNCLAYRLLADLPPRGFVEDPMNSNLSTIFLPHSALCLGLAGGLGLAVAYAAVLAAYRLWFHPLAAFPGPVLAAATGWYETYYDIYRRGKVIEQLELLHKIYGTLLPQILLCLHELIRTLAGPIVRIGPNKVRSPTAWAYLTGI